MLRAMSTHSWLEPILIVAAVMHATAMANAAGPITEAAYNRCQAIADDKARLHCFENLTLEPPQTVPSPAQAAPSGSPKIPDTPPDSSFGWRSAPASLPIAGKWRLDRTADPRDGHDIVSIMATAELSGSDVDFAGLDLRCAGQDFEILVFLIGPLPPRAQPTIAMNGMTFQGSVISPGTAILLPRSASVLAQEQWQSLSSVSIDVEDDATKIHGLVSLEGFRAASQKLAGACLMR